MSAALRSRCVGTSPMTRSACAKALGGADSSRMSSEGRIHRWLRPANATSALLDHDLGGFDHRGHFVALLEAHFFRTALGDDRFDHIVADFDRDKRGDGAENYLGDFALEMIASTKRHRGCSSHCRIYALNNLPDLPREQDRYWRLEFSHLILLESLPLLG